ncbi:MAG: protein disulfide oxidoreductase [Mycobacterium sp.]
MTVIAMKRLRFLGLWIAAIALTVGYLSPVAAGQPVAEQLQFTAKTINGQDFSGQSLARKPAVLWFWAPWCTTCQGEAPGVAKAARANPAVTFVGVAAQDQVPAMQNFVAKYGLGFTNLADLDGSIWRQFGVTIQPAFAFISPDGSVDVVKRTLSEQDLAARISTLAAA